MSGAADRSRAACLPRAALGLGELCAPVALARAVTCRRLPPTGLVVVRVLGGRHLVQAAVTGTRPSRAVEDAGAAVDAAHVATMVALAAASARWRRPALTSAAVTALLVAGDAVVRHGRH